MPSNPTMFAQQYFHGTRADLATGDLIKVGHQCNYNSPAPLSWVYFASTLDAAVWGAEMALGEGPCRIYVVEPTGPTVDDPNVTDMKFPGNPTMSFRSREPLRIVGEVVGWHGHPPEEIQAMRDTLARLKAEGTDIIFD